MGLLLRVELKRGLVPKRGQHVSVSDYINQRDENGKTAMDLARDNKHFEIVKTLETARDTPIQYAIQSKSF